MLSRKFLATPLLTLALAIQGAAARPAGQPTARPARPALWVVKDDDTTIYLFGTIHKLEHDVTWLSGAVKEAFDAAGTVVVEVDMGNTAAVPAALKAHSVAHDGMTMVERLPEAERAAYRARLAELGLPEKALDRLQPWAAASMIGSMVQRKHGVVREAGVEDQLLEAAKAGGKQLEPLETLDQQFGYFESLPAAEQVKQLVAVLHDDPSDDALFARVSVAWADGKVDRVARGMMSDLTPAMRQTLVTSRNLRWASTLKATLDRPGTFFVAVGSGHFAGPGNLLADLRAVGVRSHRLQ